MIQLLFFFILNNIFTIYIDRYNQQVLWKFCSSQYLNILFLCIIYKRLYYLQVKNNILIY